MIQSTQNAEFFRGNTPVMRRPVERLTPVESEWLEGTQTVVRAVTAESQPTPTLKELWAGTKERWNEMNTPQKIGTVIGLVRLTPQLVVFGAFVVVAPVATTVLAVPMFGAAKGIDAFWRWRREAAAKRK